MIEFAEPPIDAVIVKSFDKMRAYYSDDETIICTSGDGITPIENSSAPQAKQCAVCPQSIWGSRITPNGKRAKACTEYATLKLITLEESNRALLRVPSTSLRSFREYKKSLSSRGYGLKNVVTHINVRPLENYDLLTFKVGRFLKEIELNSIIRMSKTVRPQFEKTSGYIY
tara:strand:+ start:727 stop:1239 length:513 start_codon:yes stop_codon:yes gene_type:complete